MSNIVTSLIIVIPAAERDAANALAVEVAGEAGRDTFSVPLYPVGGPYDTPSHFWCCWAVDAATRDALLARFPDAYDASVWTPEQVLAALGLETAREELFPQETAHGLE